MVHLEHSDVDYFKVQQHCRKTKIKVHCGSAESRTEFDTSSGLVHLDEMVHSKKTFVLYYSYVGNSSVTHKLWMSIDL